jgi:hypothetical protein
MGLVLCRFVTYAVDSQYNFFTSKEPELSIEERRKIALLRLEKLDNPNTPKKIPLNPRFYRDEIRSNYDTDRNNSIVNDWRN